MKKDTKSVTKAELFEYAEQVQQLMGVITRPVEMSSDLGSKSTPLASMFPNDLEVNESKFVAVSDKYQTMDEIRKATKEDGKVLLFATYWTARHIRQFDYVNTFHLKKRTNEDVIKVIGKDLDILAPRIVLETEDTIIAVSCYTEAISLFKEEDLKPVEDIDKDGNKYTLRFSNGMEFQIYELVEETEENLADNETENEEPAETKEDKPTEEPKTTGHKKKFSSKNKKTSEKTEEDIAE